MRRQEAPLARPWRFVALHLALLAAGLAAFAWRMHGFAIDDFFITYRYAANLAAGDGFRFNPDDTVFGTTAPGFAGAAGGGTGNEGADREAYERLFAPEFRNRLDARIAFRPLTPEVMLRIVDKFLEELRGQLAAKSVELEATPEARQLLAERGHDPAFGARPLARVIDAALKRPLTDELLFGRLRDGGRVTVGVTGGELDLRIEA